MTDRQVAEAPSAQMGACGFDDLLPLVSVGFVGEWPRTR